MYNRETEPQKEAQTNKLTRLRIALAAVTILGGSTGCGSTTTASIDELSKPKVSATEKQADGIMPSEQKLGITRIPDFTPTLVASPTAEPTFPPVPPTPEQPSPTPPDPTEAPTFTPTGTPTPTETPVPPATATATPVEATPIKIPEKSPLPTYGAFMGDLFNDKTGAKEGMIVVASIPQPGQPEKYLAYYIMNDGTSRALLLNLKSVKDKSFEGTNPKTKDVSEGFYTIKASLNASDKTLTGIAETRRGQNPVEIRNFKASLVGSGRDKVLEAAKKMKTAQGGGKYGNDWTVVRVDELTQVFHIDLP